MFVTVGRLGAAMVVVMFGAACGGAEPPAPGTQAPGPAAATFLSGLHAADLAKVLRGRGLACPDPTQERDTRHWVCEASTPLIGYRVDFYGKVPGRIEYIRAVVTQSSRPKREEAVAFLDYFAGLKYQGAEPGPARAWIEGTIDTGGGRMFGPASFKLSGDLSRLVLDIKAPGSDW